jgi:hypothetical protein
LVPADGSHPDHLVRRLLVRRAQRADHRRLRGPPSRAGAAAASWPPTAHAAQTPSDPRGSRRSANSECTAQGFSHLTSWFERWSRSRPRTPSAGSWLLRDHKVVRDTPFGEDGGRSFVKTSGWALRDSNPRPARCKQSRHERCAYQGLSRSPSSDEGTIICSRSHPHPASEALRLSSGGVRALNPARQVRSFEPPLTQRRVPLRDSVGVSVAWASLMSPPGGRPRSFSRAAICSSFRLTSSSTSSLGTTSSLAAVGA